MSKQRFLSTAVLSLLLASLLAGPVNAAKPQPTASAGLLERSCDVLVSYTWTKFSGRNLIATVGLYVRTEAGDEAVSVQSFEGQRGRTGSVSFIVSLAADTYPGGRTFVAIGDLTESQTSSQVPGSSAESTTISSTCG